MERKLLYLVDSLLGLVPGLPAEARLMAQTMAARVEIERMMLLVCWIKECVKDCVFDEFVTNVWMRSE